MTTPIDDRPSLKSALQQVRSRIEAGEEPEPAMWSGFARQLGQYTEHGKRDTLNALIWIGETDWSENQAEQLAMPVRRLLEQTHGELEFDRRMPWMYGCLSSVIVLIAVMVIDFIVLLGPILLVGAIWTYFDRKRNQRVKTRDICSVALLAAAKLHSCLLIPECLRCALTFDRSFELQVNANKALMACLEATEDFTPLTGRYNLTADVPNFIYTRNFSLIVAMLPMIIQIGGAAESRALRYVLASAPQHTKPQLEEAVLQLEARLRSRKTNASLLRPTEAPSDTLLRPAGAQETDNALLVRPSEGSEG